MDESVSDSEALGSRGGRPDRDGGKGDLRGMGGACTPIRSPPGISGTEHPARVYPEAWQAGNAPVGRPLRQRPAAPRSTAHVLSTIYEANFLPCSFGGRPERGT